MTIFAFFNPDPETATTEAKPDSGDAAAKKAADDAAKAEEQRVRKIAREEARAALDEVDGDDGDGDDKGEPGTLTGGAA